MARALRPGPIVNLARAARITAAAVRRRRRERKAFAAVPKPVPWDWARDRLIPLMAGPFFGAPGEELVRSVVEPGVTVAFGIDIGHGVAPYVDAPLAERWECSADQICEAAMANLRQRAANIPAQWVESGTLSGHVVRRLRRPHAWAASVLLVRESLERLFGPADQIFGAPGQGLLLSTPTTMPPPIFAGLVAEHEMDELYPLMLDPFILSDGQLLWSGSAWPDDELDLEVG